jgi:hypothetical protein
MEKIPTAKEFAQQFNFWTTYYREHTIDHVEVHRFAIEYTKLHVKAALEAAAEKAELRDTWWGNTSSSVGDEIYYDSDGDKHTISVEKDSILNAYPLNLIQ